MMKRLSLLLLIAILPFLSGLADENPANEVRDDQPEAEDGGLAISGTPLNDVLNYLCEKAGLGYQHNPRLAGPEFVVKGRIPPGAPQEQIDAVLKPLGCLFISEKISATATPKSRLRRPS